MTSMDTASSDTETAAPSAVKATRRPLPAYFEVLKPKETALLTFIGLAAALLAARGHPDPGRLGIAFVAILIASGGCNAITNYLDRNVDALMRRTSYRAIPSRRIYPAEKALPLAIGLVVIGLVIAAWLNPLTLVFGLLGTLTAVVGRKMSITHILGGISSCAPVVVGWLAFGPNLTPTLWLLCALIMVWVPIHVWSLMMAYREDYLQAGVRMFPVTWDIGSATRMLLGLSVLLWAISIALYFVAGLGVIYLAVSVILGGIMVYANLRLVGSDAHKTAWKVYKLSAYPYLGIIFLAMFVGLWV